MSIIKNLLKFINLFQIIYLVNKSQNLKQVFERYNKVKIPYKKNKICCILTKNILN